MTASIRTSYLNYHRNNYFLELNRSLLNRLEPSNGLYLQVLKQHLTLLEQKYDIDKLLNRNEQLKKMRDECENISIKGLTSFTILYQNPDYQEIRKTFDQFEALIRRIDSECLPKNSITNSLKDTISIMNNPRLDHAVWSRNMADVLILFLGVSAPELVKLLQLISLVNGFASYGFYVARGGIDLAMGIKHVCLDTELEKEGIGKADEMYFQAEQRYYRVMNDIALWAPVNFLTFHYLTGPGYLGFLGTALTVALLVGDTLLSMVVYRHKQIQFKSFIETITDDKYREKLEKIHQDEQEKLFYTIVYQALLVASFSLFLANTMPFILAGSVVICFLQVLFKEKDLIIELFKSDNAQPLILSKMLINFLEHISIPAVFLVAGLVVMPMLPGISPLLIFCVCAAISAMLMRVSSMALDACDRNLQPKKPHLA